MGTITLDPTSSFISPLLPGDSSNLPIKPPLLGAGLVPAPWWDLREVGAIS